MNKQLRKTNRLWLWSMVLLMASSAAWAQVSFTSGVLSYTQSFDGLANAGTTNPWVDNSTIPGWYSNRTVYLANNGNTNNGGLYSFGSDALDRSLGSLGSGTANPVVYGVQFTNNTGTTINSIAVQYRGEQWRKGTNANTLTFGYKVGATAITDADYTTVSSLNFVGPQTGTTTPLNLDGNTTGGQLTATIPVTVNNGQTIWLRWSDVDDTGADAGLSVDNLTVTATTAGPALPVLTINDVTQVEGNTGTTTFNYMVNLSAPAGPGGVTFDIATADNTATTATNDYVANSLIGQTIPSGSSTYTFAVTVNGDTDFEPNETFFVNIANATGATVSDGQGLGTITNDDVSAFPIVSIAATDATGAEAASDPITFTVSRTGDVTSPLDVTYTVGGTATNGTDYTPTLAGTVTIPASASSVAITLTPVDDADLDANETIVLTLTDSEAYDLGSTSATGTITDNEMAPGTRIRDIQGPGHISPLAGTTVSNVPGIVTVLRNNGFWMQDPTPDANDNTSEGIFVFTSSASGRTVGESVTVSGTVQELRANAQNLSSTQITNPTVTVVSTGNELPAPIVISSQIIAGVRRIPTNTISNDFPTGGDVELSVFDPAEDGLDFFETLEGMRVQINNPVTTSLRNNFGEVYVIADRGAGATGLNARGTLTISGANTTDINSAITNSDFNPERIQIDDVLYGTGGTPNENVGTLLNTIVGVVNYDFLSFEILPSVAPTVSSANVPLTKETTNLVPTTNQLTIASFNVENLAGNEPQAKYDGLALGIKNSLGAPDILALEEIQDNDGASNSSVVDATTTLTRLRDAIAAAGGPTYDFRQINPVDDQDGGQPGGNIRVGLFFNPARVQFVDRPGGGPAVNTTVSNVGGEPRISASPGRILDTNPGESDSYAGDDFTATRKPLVGEFIFNGQPLYLIVNHFSSRGGSGALSQRIQPPLQEEQGRREEQAKIVNAFVDQLLAVNPNANVVLAGDFNEFQFLPALQYLKGNVPGETPVLTNLIESLPAQERYTYTFDGNAQALDYILGSNSMNSKLDAYDAVHINSEFLDQLSDHDPSVVRFNFPAVATPLALTLTASPTMLLTTGTTSLSATVSGGTTPYSYTFSGPGTITQTPGSNTASVSGLSAGVQTFTVLVSDVTTPSSQTISATVSVTVNEANTAPTVANEIAPQSATVGQAYSYVIPANTFTDANGDALTLTVSGLPAGLSFDAGTTAINGVPTTATLVSVTVTATDPGSLSASTSFSFTVSPAASMTTTAPFAITGVTTISCTPVANRINLSFDPQYTGLNGQPVSFSVVNELAATTAAGPYTLSLYTDNPVITLQAVQAGTTTSFTYNWLAACNAQVPGNTAPTVANPIPPQSATVGQAYSYVIPANTFTDAQTPNGLALSASGLPAGLSLSGSTISGTPSTTVGSPFSVTITATDPGNLSASTSFGFTISPAMSVTTTAPFAITGVTTIDCTPVANRVNLTFNPQYAGLTGQPITFSVVNELAPTTAAGPYSLTLYPDNPIITLKATQAGTTGEASFSYNWLAACNGMVPGNTAPTVANAIPSQSATVGQAFSYVIPANTFTDAQTPNGLTLSASGLPAGLSLSGSTISGTPSTTVGSPYSVTITATDPGNLSASTSFGFTISPASSVTTTAPFAITGVTTVSCAVMNASTGERSVTFNPQYAGVNGQSISFSVVNELGATTASGPYTLRLYTDNPVISLKATQSGTAGEASFSYNWLAACTTGSARSSAEPTAKLQVRVLGNPVQNTVEVEVTGAEGTDLNLSLTNLQSQIVGQSRTEQANKVERYRFNVSGQPAGVLLLRVSNSNQIGTLRILKGK